MLNFHVILVVVCLLFSMNSQARSLYWEDLTVNATLQADGSLRVIERQHMVFDGAWNGGERTFYKGWRHGLNLLRVSRINPATQQGIDLIKGDLSLVDQYKFTDSNTLRWRSRLPSEPAYRNKHLIYELEYVYSNILEFKDGKFILNHDFAFRDRPGEFHNYQLTINLDPVWQATSPSFMSTVSEKNLMPGSGVVIWTQLTYQGQVFPGAVVRVLPMKWRVALLLCLLMFIGYYLLKWVRHEIYKGRFIPLISVNEISDTWLEQHVLSELPEHVGSLWDLDTGAAEVSAMLARMTLEGKIKSHITYSGFWVFKKPILHLELVVPKRELARHESRLIHLLFPKGNMTDTKMIRKYYRSHGFDPALQIESKMKGYRLLKKYSSVYGRTKSYTFWLFIAAIICVPPAILVDGLFSFVFIGPAILTAALASIIFKYQGIRLQTEVERPILGLLKLLFWYGILFGFIGIFILSGHGAPSIWIYLIFILIMSAIFMIMLNAARTNVSEKAVRQRKNLCAARRYFQSELRKPKPSLRDEWYPYLIAFGLDKQMQKWFRAFRSDDTDDDYRQSYTSSSGSPTASNRWSGGGGTFGGAGASGAWSAAASAMSSGVPAPTSSSSGGGSSSSGGGGGSSGGGGGGGW